jgi:cysteine desulfurase/selenocysteine lyase
MSTSDPSGLGPALPAEAAVSGTPASPELIASEVARLATQILAQFPGPGAMAAAPAPPAPAFPSAWGPSATHVGAGGTSTALAAPPVPGAFQHPPVASAPPPKESDLRNIPALLSETLGFGSPVTLAQGPSVVPSVGPSSVSPLPASGYAPAAGGTPPSPPLPGGAPSAASSPAGSEPYFLSLAGLPTSAPAAPAAPSLPAAPTSSTPSGVPTSSGVPFEVTPALVPALAPSSTPGLFDALSIKRDFPILRERVHGKPLVWLDNAATTQKPQAVIDRLAYYYEHENSNVHRAAHTLSARATDAYEGARDKVRRFLNAPSAQEIVFARGATEAINLVAQSWGRRNVNPGDEIVISWLEHHANIVPWQMLAADRGAKLRVAPVDDRGQIRLDEYEKLLGPRTRLVAITQVSNALGTITPAREMVAMAHRHGAKVLVDGAQAVSHMRVDVQALDCDFYCFSGHKVFAPTGIGALFGKAAVLESMPPWQGGGNMISDVTFEKTSYQAPPWRFEAGTGNIADAVGLGAALDYVSAIGLENISRYEHELLVYATEQLTGCVPGLRMIGTADDKAGVLSFVIDGVRTEDVGAALDREGIAVRSGHHCAQPILRRFGLESTVRASLAPYNTKDDVDALVTALQRIEPVREPKGGGRARTS